MAQQAYDEALTQVNDAVVDAFMASPGSSANADVLGAFEDLGGEPLLWDHIPLALPIAADERDHDLVDELPAALPHHALLF